MKIIKVVLIISLLLPLTSCAQQLNNSLAEEILTPIYWYIDKSGDEYEMSTMYPPISTEYKMLYKQKVSMYEEVDRLINDTFNRQLRSGQLKVIFLSEAVASSDLNSLLNVLLTSTEISERVYFVVVRGDFNTFIEKITEKNMNYDYLFYKRLKRYERRGEISTVNFIEFYRDYMTDYADPYLPIYEVEEDKLVYKATGLFKDTTMAYQLTEKEDLYFQMLKPKHYLGDLTIEDLKVVLAGVKAKVKYNLHLNQNTLDVYVDVNTRLSQYNGDLNLSDKKEKENFILSIQDEIESNMEQLYSQFQKYNVDPLKVGTLTLKPFSAPMSNEDWFRHWQKLNINVDVKLKVDITDDPRLYGTDKKK